MGCGYLTCTGSGVFYSLGRQLQLASIRLTVFYRPWCGELMCTISQHSWWFRVSAPTSVLWAILAAYGVCVQFGLWLVSSSCSDWFWVSKCNIGPIYFACTPLCIKQFITWWSTEQRVFDVPQKTEEEGLKWLERFADEQRRGECFWKHWHTGA